jgi:hypothetical protein
MVLKLAGEYGEHPPKEIIAVCAISPSVDLAASGNLICERSNWIYHRDFVRRLKNRIRLKGRMYPEIYDTSNLHLVRTIIEFDDRFTSVAHGFANAADYYYKASSLRVMHKIRVPTLIIRRLAVIHTYCWSILSVAATLLFSVLLGITKIGSGRKTDSWNFASSRTVLCRRVAFQSLSGIYCWT